MAQETKSRGMLLWSTIWGGQLVSLVGSGLTSFALGVWAYQRSGSVTQFALIVFFAGLPGILLAPVAGTLVDRWDRKWVMIGADTLSGVITLVVALLLWTGQSPGLAHLHRGGGQLGVQDLPVARLHRGHHADGAEEALRPGRRHDAVRPGRLRASWRRSWPAC